MVVCGDEVDGDEADELWFSLKVAARDRAAFARREGAREGASETRAPRRNERARLLAGVEYHVHQALTSIWLVKAHASE